MWSPNGSLLYSGVALPFVYFYRPPQRKYRDFLENSGMAAVVFLLLLKNYCDPPVQFG